MVVVQRDSLKKEEGGAGRDSTAPLDGGWGWVVVFASFMIHVIADGVTYTFGIFYYEFLKHFHESKGSTAWVASIMVGTTYCIGPIASGLTNKYGCRAVTIAGALLAALGLMLGTLAPNVIYLYFTIGVCTGAGFGLMYLPSIVSVTCHFEKQRAFATGVAVCGSGMGTFALAPLIEHLVETYGWKGAMLIISGLVLNCTVFGALFRPLEVPPSPPKQQQLRPTKLTMVNGAIVSSGQLSSAAEDGACTSLMFKAKSPTILEESPKKKSPDDSLRKQSLEEAVDGGTALLQGSFPVVVVSSSSGYSTNPSTPTGGAAVGMNGYCKDVGLRVNRYTGDVLLDRDEISPLRNSLMLPGDFVRRKVENGPLSSFVCSSASLAQTNKELESCSRAHPVGLMYRKDIFYSGSLVSIAKYRSNPNVSYCAAETRAAKRKSMSRLLCCPQEIRDALLEMTDLSLLRDPVFLMFSASNFLTSVGFNVPYVYTKDRVAEMAIASNEEASFLLAIIGISNTVGRVTLGYLSDRACVNRLWIYNCSLVLCGLATALSCYAFNYTLMAMYCATFGATSGAYVSLTSVILVDLLGLDKLTNAFGILLVFEGVSCLLGPPITGWLYDALGSYDPGFYVSGCMIAASGLILFLVPCVRRTLADRRQDPEDPKTAVEAAA